MPCLPAEMYKNKLGNHGSSCHLFTLNNLGDLQLQNYFQTLSWFNFMLNWLITELSDISTENLLKSYYRAGLLLYSCGWNPNGTAATYLGNPGFLLWLSWELCASRPCSASGAELAGICFSIGSKLRKHRSPGIKDVDWGLLIPMMHCVLFQLLRKLVYLKMWVWLDLKQKQRNSLAVST